MMTAALTYFERTSALLESADRPAPNREAAVCASSIANQIGFPVR
jgi:hypothetical protein